MGPTAPPGMNLHVEKKFCRDGSQCTSRDELERRYVPLYHLGRTIAEAGPTVPI